MLIPSAVLSNRNIRLNFLHYSADLGSGTTRTASGVTFGAASSDRMIVVAVVHAISGTSTVNSVTVGGVSATKICQANGNNIGVSLFSAVVPTGTSGNVVITWGTSVARSYIGVYSLKCLDSTTVLDYDAPAGGKETTRTATINVPKGGAVISCVYSETYPIVFTGTTTDYYSTERGFGSIITTSADATFDVSTSCRAICAAVWR